MLREGFYFQQNPLVKDCACKLNDVFRTIYFDCKFLYARFKKNQTPINCRFFISVAKARFEKK